VEEEKDKATTLMGGLPQTDESDDMFIAAMKNSKAEHNHYAAIGRVAAAWSYLEASVDTASIRLAGVDSDVGVCLTSQIAGIGRKLDAYIALSRLRKLPSELIDRLNKFSQKAAGLGEKRNRFVHDIWFFNHPGPPERLEATARKLLRFEYIPTKTDDIVRFAWELGDLNGDFDVLSQAVETWPLSSSDISPQSPL
jgi:hypothetical protein